MGSKAAMCTPGTHALPQSNESPKVRVGSADSRSRPAAHIKQLRNRLWRTSGGSATVLPDLPGTLAARSNQVMIEHGDRHGHIVVRYLCSFAAHSRNRALF